MRFAPSYSAFSLFPRPAPSRAPGWEGRASIDSEGGSEGRERALPCVLLRGTKNPPGSGWVYVLMRSRRQVISSTRRSVGRSVGHTGGVITSRSGGICNGAHLNLAKQFRNLFRGSASALLHASGSPAEEAAVGRCSRKYRPSNGLIPGGQPGGGFWFCVRLSHAPGGLPLHPWVKT